MLLSHLHPDHCMDLCGYYVMRKYHPSGPQPRIPVYGPAGVADRLARAYDLPLDPGMHEEYDFREYDGPFEIGPFSVLPVPVEHPVPAYGLRITAGGAVLGYSGDTAPCEGVDRVAAEARLLLARGVVPRPRREPARHPPHRPRRRRGRRARWRRPARAHPHPALVRQGGDARRGAARLLRPRRARRRAGAVYELLRLASIHW